MVPAFDDLLHKGVLSPPLKQMMIIYVAALNRCPYCATSHSLQLLQMGELPPEAAWALYAGDLDGANLPPAEQRLLELIQTLTAHPYWICDQQIEELRALGWSDEQIAEAVYVGAAANMMVRVADAFALETPFALDGIGEPGAELPPGSSSGPCL